MKIVALLCLFFVSAISSHARQISDTLKAELGEVEVVGYETNRSLLETPGSISFIDAELTGGFTNSSPLFGLNTVPGIRVEQRAPGSYRVAIRGSSLRSPFGVRNVKIYWNGIPFTEPSGNTPFNLLDMINMQDVEVIRGPAGSIYGAGNGGVLLLESNQHSNSVEAVSSFGSYGFQRYSLHAQSDFRNGNLRFNYSNQHSDGYREQSFFRRKTAELSGNFRLTEHQTISTSFLYSDLNYGIPGALTLEQMRENPQQARPGNNFALGSVEANSSIDHKAFLAGITYKTEFENGISNKASAFGTFSDFNHPFNLDYKIDSRKGGGLRNIFSLNKDFGSIKTRFTLGGEFQASAYAARNFENNFGTPGPLNFDDQIEIQSSLVFAGAEIDFPYQFYLSAGLSYNRLEYSLNRLVTNLPEDSEGIARKTFDPEIIPRIGLTKKFSTAASLYGSISYGFSPPTIEEFRTNEGSVNLDLEAEQGTNYEIGVRGFLEGRFSYDLAAFYFRLDETIVQQQSNRGTVLFENAGNTDQYGLEFASSWIIFKNEALLDQLKWNLSYTYHHFRYKNYIRDSGNFSGNELTGVAPHNIVSVLDAELTSGFYAMLSYNFTDEIPLNDANTVYSDSYHLLQSKVGFQTKIFQNMNLDLFVGVDNLLNVKYSLGNDLNAFGERYYQPAAPRNWFGGLKLIYEL